MWVIKKIYIYIYIYMNTCMKIADALRRAYKAPISERFIAQRFAAFLPKCPRYFSGKKTREKIYTNCQLNKIMYLCEIDREKPIFV